LGVAGFAAFEATAHDVHETLHRHELWILAVSAALVVIGGAAEWAVRQGGRRKGFPILFAISAACLIANTAIIAGHRAPITSAAHEAHQERTTALAHEGHSHAH
jgi:hypothetical protein